MKESSHPGASIQQSLTDVAAVVGSHQFKSEDLLAYEAGYRFQATHSLSIDIAAFYNNYTSLRSAEPGAPFIEGSPIPTDLVLPFIASNKMSGGTYGIEPFADWKVFPKWRLRGSYSYLQMNIRKDRGSLDPTLTIQTARVLVISSILGHHSTFPDIWSTISLFDTWTNYQVSIYQLLLPGYSCRMEAIHSARAVCHWPKPIEQSPPGIHARVHQHNSDSSWPDNQWARYLEF